MTDREKIANNMLQEIASDICKKLPKDFGFCLLAYEFGDADNRQMLYVSNSNRSDIHKAMLEFIENTKE